MKKQTVFIKRYPSKGELPNKDGWYFTNRGLYFIYVSNLSYIKECEYFLEEIEIPSEDFFIKEVERMTNHSLNKEIISLSYLICEKFILNKMKGEIK